MKKLLTIGYEGASVDDFVATLKFAGVDLLLDVRELPLSRKSGFSKRALSEILAGEGIAYRHERALGSPKAIRNDLRADGDYPKFFRSFSAYLRTQEQLLLGLIENLEGKVALMCYERDPEECHRRIVAQRIATLTGLTPLHLGVQEGVGEKRTRANSRQSLSAA